MCCRGAGLYTGTTANASSSTGGGSNGDRMQAGGAGGGKGLGMYQALDKPNSAGGMF